MSEKFAAPQPDYLVKRGDGRISVMRPTRQGYREQGSLDADLNPTMRRAVQVQHDELETNSAGETGYPQRYISDEQMSPGYQAKLAEELHASIEHPDEDIKQTRRRSVVDLGGKAVSSLIDHVPGVPQRINVVSQSGPGTRVPVERVTDPRKVIGHPSRGDNDMNVAYRDYVDRSGQ